MVAPVCAQEVIMSVTSEIQSLFDRFIAAWNRNDARGCAGEFAADGSLINPFGQEARGSEAIAGLYAEYFATMLKGTTTTFTRSNIRELGSLALIDGTQTVDNLRAPDGSNAPALVIHLVTLAQRSGDRWQFLDARPYAFMTIPQG